MVKVKICGITTKEDALHAANAGAWALGFNFYKGSKRYVGPSKVKKIIEEVPPFVTPVGIFVNQKIGAIRDIITYCGLHAVQLHGNEDHHFCHRLKRYGVKIIKAFGIQEGFDSSVLKNFHVDAFLFDTHDPEHFGGTGRTWNWKAVKELRSFNKPIIISGGLTPSNVQEAIALSSPYAVDVASGVEDTPGIKNHRLVEEFIRVTRVGDSH